LGRGGDDSIDGGAGNDFIAGDQTLANDGRDDIAGGDGDDTIYGDSAAGTDNSPTVVSWADQGVADETSITGGLTAVSADGNIQIAVSVNQEANFYGASVETGDALFDYNGVSDTSSLAIEGGDIPTGGTVGNDQNAAVVTLDFSAAEAGYSDEVENVTFGIFDIDDLDAQFLDQVIVTAYDANGNSIPVTVTLGSTTTLTSTTNANGSQTVTAINNSGGAGNTDSNTGFAQFSVAGPVSYIEVDYNNVDTAYGGHAIRIGDITATPIPQAPDGGNDDTIAGDAGNDVIYGQGGNDTIDGGADDDSIYGGAGNDIISDSGTSGDYIEGGTGEDTIDAGAGQDTVYGGADNDDIDGQGGNDTLFGGAGADEVFGGGGTDTIYGGDDGNDQLFGKEDDDAIYASSGENSAFGDAGNDSIFMGTGNDYIDGGTGDDTAYGGAGNDTMFGASGNDRLEGDGRRSGIRHADHRRQYSHIRQYRNRDLGRWR